MLVKLATVLLSALALLGCEVPFYWQAINGQWQLIQQRQSIAELLDSPDTPEQLKQQLSYGMEARSYAFQQLHLDNKNGSYQAYVDLHRAHVVWNVFATPALSMANHTWCYPIAGCVSYRGYFSEEKANAFAETLNQQGFDTYVGGVDAYSTLGWFDDPILSSFIDRTPLSLAALLFHELAHQTLYVKGDTVFNESYATAVEQILLNMWVSKQGLEDDWNRFQKAKKYRNDFLNLVIPHKSKREQLFSNALSENEKQHGKQALINQLQQEYEALKQSWGGYSGYDSWFQKGVNNAQLSTVATYHELTPGFHALFQETHDDLTAFIKRCHTLSKQSKDERHNTLIQLAEKNFGYTQE